MHQPARGAPLYIFQASSEREFDAHQALYLVHSLIALGPVALQIVARPQGIRWQALDLSGRLNVLSTLQAPQVAVKTRRYQAQTQKYPLYRAKLSYETFHYASHPLPYITDFRPVGDPLLPLAQTMSYLQDGEEIRYTLIVHEPNKPRIFAGLAMANEVLSGDYGLRHLDTYEQVKRHKQQQMWFAVFLSIDIDAPSGSRTNELRQAVNLQISSAFDRSQSNHPPNGLRARGFPRLTQITDFQRDQRTQTLNWYSRTRQDVQWQDWWAKRWLYLTPSEIACLWHLPHTSFTEANILWTQPQPPAPYVIAQNTHGLILGQARYQAKKVLARLHPSDRDTHTAIVGRTGVGKSTAMHHQIDQDIRAGHGVFVLDPHGELIRKILRTSIPPQRENDLIVLDLADESHAIPLNLFAGEQSYSAIGRVVDIIDRTFAAGGVQIDKFLRAGIKALQHVEDATMVDLFLLFTDPHYRGNLLKHIHDLETYQTLYDDYHTAGVGQQRRIRGPLLNRISPFIANPYLFPSLCHPQRINLSEWIDQQKIVLVSLAANVEDVPKTERDLVGAMLISLLQMIGMRPHRQPQRFYIYIDEVQNFITSSLEVVFSQARKYGLAMTVAHQHFNQLNAETLSGILGNVGTLMIFPTNVDDAQKLAPYLQPQFSVANLVKLNRFQAAVKLQYQGESQDAFLVMGEKPINESDGAVQREQYLRTLAKQNYTPLRRAEILTWLNDRYPKLAPDVLRQTRDEIDDLKRTQDIDYDQFTE